MAQPPRKRPEQADALALIRQIRAASMITGPARAVLYVLASYADGQARAYPPQQLIADGAGIQLRTVRKWLAELEDRAVIRAVGKHKWPNGKLSDVWQILELQLAKFTPPAQGTGQKPETVDNPVETLGDDEGLTGTSCQTDRHLVPDRPARGAAILPVDLPEDRPDPDPPTPKGGRTMDLDLDPLLNAVRDSLDFQYTIHTRKSALSDSRGVLYTCKRCKHATDGRTLERDRAEYQRRVNAARQAGEDDIDTDDLHLGCLHCESYDLAEERVDVDGWLWSFVRRRREPMQPLLTRVREVYAGRVRTETVAAIAATWASEKLGRNTT
jgi:hypothetical protein